MSKIGHRISVARSNLNINQKELAEKANLKESSLSRYINNEREPRASTIKVLAEALGVSADYLVGISDEIGIDGFNSNNKDMVNIEDMIPNIFENKKVLYKDRLLNNEELEKVLYVMEFAIKFSLDSK